MANNQEFYGFPQPISQIFPAPIKAARAPTTSDIQYPIGQTWVDTVGDDAYILVDVTAASATWNVMATFPGNVDTLTGDTGGPIAPSAGNINIVGGDGVTVDGSGNTLTINTQADNYPITPYVVGPSGQAGYQTIQSALNAANAAGGNATVYVQPGTYTENLTLFDTVDIHGSIFSGAIITGVHTPPASGRVSFQNLTLTSATHILSSAVAGSTEIVIEDCILNVTNGYVFNLANWTGDLLIDDCGSIGTNDGVVNNTGGAFVKITDATVGAGTGNAFTYSGGALQIENVVVQCPVTVGTGSTVTVREGSVFTRTFTTANDSIVSIVDAQFSTGATASISHGSSGTLALSGVTINSSNNPSITGAGAGALTMSDVSFLNNSSIAGTLTPASGIIRGGNFISQYVVGPAPDAKYQTIQSAITAAAAAGGVATVMVKPGTYTENLTLSSTVDIRGEIFSGVTITGVHTPPTSGRVTFQNLTLTSATHILSSVAAGTTDIVIEDCILDVTNGYVFNLASWTGDLIIDDVGSIGTNDGVVNNTGGSFVKITDSTVGAGTGNTFTYNGGTLQIENVVVQCPVSVGTGSTATIREGSVFTRTFTSANNSIVSIVDAQFSTGATAAISHGSSGTFTLANAVINSSNNPAITGAGAGTLTMANVTFLNNSSIAGTLTTAAGVVRGGNFISQYVVGTSPDAKYQTIQSAITAAAAAGGNATVFVKPGTYTENLTLSSTVDIRGEVYSGVTITGVHTPPASGRVTFQNCTLTSATHILSSAVAGSATLSIEDCILTVTNGYVFNLVNWTGVLLIDDCGSTGGTNDGVVNNTGGATVKLTDCTVGVGTGNAFTYNGGSLTLEGVVLNSTITIGTGSTLTARLGTTFGATLTTANNSIANITDCIFSTGATAAISHGSSGAVAISTSVINSSNNPSIAGAGAGVLTLGNITFVSNSSLAGTLTTAWLTTKTGPLNIAGNLSLDSVATTIFLNGGAVTDFIGTATLTSGTVTVSNTNITAADRIIVTRSAKNASTAYGTFEVVKTPATNFVITSCKSDTTTETNDASTVDYFIVRQT